MATRFALYACPVFHALILERQCEVNRKRYARAQAERVVPSRRRTPEEHGALYSDGDLAVCMTCPGVRALSKGRVAKVVEVGN
jgi:hypothetical protein